MHGPFSSQCLEATRCALPVRQIQPAIDLNGPPYQHAFPRHIQEQAAHLFGDLASNIEHPLGLGAFGYSASVNYCMTQALAAGGVGTGTCMGEERIRALATEAGFSRVDRVDYPNNPFNIFYVLQL